MATPCMLKVPDKTRHLITRTEFNIRRVFS